MLALFFSWRATARLSTRGQRLGLLALRTTAAIACWFLLLSPAIELRHVQKIQNHLPVFLDNSASMRIQVHHDGKSRMQALKAFFRRNHTYFESLKKKQKLRFYTLSREIKALQKPIEKLRADGDQTNLTKILETLQEKYHDQPLAGLLLVTDGRDTSKLAQQLSGTVSRKTTMLKHRTHIRRRLQQFVQSLKKLGVPVHLVTPRVRSKLRDIAVTDIYGDAFAFLHNTATIEVRLRVQGFHGIRIPVSLYREGQLLKSQVLSLHTDKKEYLVSFRFKPRKAGKFVYSIRVPVMKGEAVVENNRKDFILKIIRDRIRVLQVVGRPSWDVRFLRRLLKKNANIDLISFFILRTPHDIQRVSPNEIALIPFPSRELFTKALPSFDLVIFQNFNYAPYLRRSYLYRIAKFIRGGGAFVMIGGDLSFGAGGYLGTHLERALPTHLGYGHIDSRWFRPKLSPLGKHHPITRLFENPKQLQNLWQAFPKVPGTNLVGRPRANSTVLLEHPFLKLDSGAPLPVLSVGEYGKGRVMALSIDGSWRWNLTHIGKGGTRSPYYRFWNNAIRWLIRDPELEQVQVTTFRTSYLYGKKARFRIKVLDRRYRPSRKGAVKIRITQAPDGKVLHRSTRRLRTKDSLPFSWLPPKPGMYRIRVESRRGKRRIFGTEVFQVRGVHDEFQEVQPNTKLFTSIQRATKGKHLHFDDKISYLPFRPPTVLRVDRSRTVDLWDNSYLLGFFFLFFFLEWTLRKRWGLP